jgi:hypothetical protein
LPAERLQPGKSFGPFWEGTELQFSRLENHQILTRKMSPGQ